MNNGAVLDLLRRDTWDIASDRTDAGAALVRYRSPVPSVAEVAGYDRIVKIVWRFGDTGASVLPPDETSARMDDFEDGLCEAIEHDGRAILAAIHTFGGAREWMVYTVDVTECRGKISAMPQVAEPYPVEMADEGDVGWAYVRGILARFPRQPM